MAGMPGPTRSTFVYLYHITRIVVSYCPVFPGTLRVLWVIRSPVTLNRKILFGTPNVAGFSKSRKYISDNLYEVSDFPTEDKTSLRLVQPDTDRKK